MMVNGSGLDNVPIYSLNLSNSFTPQLSKFKPRPVHVRTESAIDRYSCKPLWAWYNLPVDTTSGCWMEDAVLDEEAVTRCYDVVQYSTM